MQTGEEILYEIKANSSQLLTEFAKVKASMHSLQKKQSEVEKSTRKMSGAFNSAGLAIKGFLARITLSALSRFVDFAGRIDSIRTSFYSLTGTTREASEALVKSIRDAANGTISNIDIMKSSALALQLMGEDVAQNLPQMARIALASARATGQDASQLFNDIIVASGRQSVMILDNLGISSVTAGQKMDEFAARLGKTRDQLTETQKRQAFFYAVMEAGTELIERSGMGTMTLGERIQKLKTQAENAATTFATRLTPALNELMDTLSNEPEGGTGLIDFVAKVSGSIVILGTILLEGLKNIGNIFISWWYRFKTNFWLDIEMMFQRLSDSYRNMGLDRLANMLHNASSRISVYRAEANEASRVTDNYDRRLRQLTQALNETWNNPSSAGREATRRIQQQGRAHQSAAAAARQQANAARQLNDDFKKFLQGSNDSSFLNAAQAEKEIKDLTTRYMALIEARNADGTFFLTAAQIKQLNQSYEAQVDGLIDRTDLFKAQLSKGLQSSFETAFTAIDQANRQLIYNLMWGKGGWNEFKKSFQDIMKQLVADITYMTIRAAALQAIFTGIGLGTGGLGGGLIGGAITGGLGKLLQDGGVPVATGKNIKIPVFAAGHIPNDHFLSYIAANEAVINARSTAANAGLLKWINDNPGQPAVFEPTIVVRSPILLDGKQITEVVDKHRSDKARARGTQDYKRRH